MRVGPFRFRLTFSARCRVPTAARACVLRGARRTLVVIPRNTYSRLLRPRMTYLIHLSVVSSTEIRRLNRKWRRKDRVTDVLSFSRLGGMPMPHPEVGDVVLCSARAREQAPQWGNDYPSELERLTVHGILHLFGYDHERSRKEAKKMFALQERILSGN